MKRKEKEITDRAAIDSLIERAAVCRLGLCRDGRPYVVPLNFGYENGVLYFHSARKGQKIDFISANGRVCFELDLDHEIVTADAPCRWTMKFRSVIGIGHAVIVEDGKERLRGLKVIMRHYARLAGGNDTFTDEEFEPAVLEKTAVIRVDIDSVTGKQSGY